MTGFIDERLPDCFGYGFQGGPEWNTSIVELDNGGEIRNAQWKYPKHRYSARYNNLEADVRDVVRNAFYAARGCLYAFRFRDWIDFEATAEPLAPNVGTRDPVQLIKTYRTGPAATTRRIQAVASATVQNTGGVVAGALDAGRGLFTPAAPWAAGVHTWTGEFDLWVRFDSDYGAFTISDLDAHSSDIELIEVRR